MRPEFYLPAPAGTKVLFQTYAGHGYNSKVTARKMDMYFLGSDGRWSWPTSSVRAMAAGTVHESFYPGGIEINHGAGWFTTYMHMASHVPVGTKVKRGDYVGTAGSVGTGVKHLHCEQLYDPNRSNDADTSDITAPDFEEAITEMPGTKLMSGPFILKLGKFYTGTSRNGIRPPATTPPKPRPKPNTPAPRPHIPLPTKADPPRHPPVKPPSPPVVPAMRVVKTITVQRGDTLTSICAQFPQAWITPNSVTRLNKLKSPNDIYPGQLLKIGG